ncbi:hypothetical protein EYV94_27635 [Puteibacter caeruleilacunae]|nr:hypothetical protein EYV94_27635 [Puteibacter caeruleilacunae]
MINKTKIQQALIIALSFIMVMSCRDIIENDISDKSVELSSPVDDLETTDTKIKFVWDDVSDATAYTLQVVKPNAGNNVMVEDTTIENTWFELDLSPGQYKWRVNAANSVSETSFSERSLQVKPKFDISKEAVTLSAPENGTVYTASAISLAWEKLTHAHTYSVVIKKGDWTSTDEVYNDKTTQQSLDITLDDGDYSWGVAANDTIYKKSTSFVVRQLFVDSSAPDAPQLTTPASEASLQDPEVLFKWTSTEANASFELEVSTNADCSDPLFKKTVDATSSVITLTNDGKYYWRVRAIDAAGNVGAFSSIRKFNIDEVKDLSAEIVTLMAPAADLSTAVKTLTFWWEEVSGATKYRLQIVSPSFDNIERLIEDVEVTGNKKTVTLTEGTYQWRVKAVNAESKTGYSVRTIEILP